MGRLQIVITEKTITYEARNTLTRAGPVTVGRIPHGPPGAMRTWDFVGVLPSSCNREDKGRMLGRGLRWCSEATKASSEG
jgi:hypothetical protein